MENVITLNFSGSTMNPPAAGRFNERSKMMSEACLTGRQVGRPETEVKKQNTQIRNKKHKHVIMLDVLFRLLTSVFCLFQ
jgi:hypothetical protein